MRIAGRYRLAESVGQGGMGRVWRACDEMLERQVAVKELRLDGPGADPDERTRRERALREARAGARIDHPGVVRVYDVAEEDDRLWIVMELVEAPSLEQTVARYGSLGVRETARIGLALAEALRRVHAAGVLHRDVKPGNVLLGPGRRVVLTDFGIAAVQDTQRLTQDGLLVGSPEYMPPERATGGVPGPASDWWSLGATLCTALTGRSPFARPSAPGTLYAVVYEEPELPGADCPLTPLLRELLAKDPARRPGADEIVAALAAVAARPEASSEPVRDVRSRLLVVLVLIAAAAVAVVMAVTAIPSGGDTHLPEVTPTPTVAGTSRPPSP
ncbi:serine/threonine-protein kinase [Streptomyces justiciae]|uniref:serine/threonine-protein kinase n=1 Tax=Streptomyces justiciae TaxID=2780140 RepID=UPI0021174D0A|nr:serine/threonine-protein kinase [Streptomyces justiciae]MCW8376745.1 serine/threonine protein kinase [Streptomyces justiciae]